MYFERVLTRGDNGEQVTQLQEWLRHLGHYEGMVDGDFGEVTARALERFQDTQGLQRDGLVEAATWEALQLHANYTVQPESQYRQWSDDGKWWWDGTDWRAVDGQEAAADPATTQDSGQTELQLSPDGQWQWDGAQWLPVGEEVALAGFPGGHSQAGDAALPQAQAGPFGTADQSGHSGGLTTESTADALTGFERGMADLLPEHKRILDRIVADLNAHPLVGGHVMLTGGTDRVGDKAANKAFGQQWADMVRDYLQAYLTDEETRHSLRANSLGAPDDGPKSGNPSLCRVEITITRRSVNLPKPHPTDRLPKDLPSGKLDDKFNLPRPKYKEPDPKHPDWPDWFWTEVKKWPPRPSVVTELWTLVNQGVAKVDIAKIAGRLASVFHLDGTKVEKFLHDTFDEAGEDAVKFLLKEIIEKGTVDETEPQANPHGPAGHPAVPEPDGKGTIRF